MSFSLPRRRFIAASAALGVAAVASACTEEMPPPEPEEPTTEPEVEPSPTVTHDENNPFKVASPSQVEAVVFDGGFGTEFAAHAALMVEDLHDGVTVKVADTSQITHDLGPRFEAGDPPDVINNSGLGAMAIAPLVDQLVDLSVVIDSDNYEGEPIRDTLFEGALDSGFFSGELKALNYALTSFGLWYSGTLFNQYGWEPPRTWAETMALGEAARATGRYLFLWGDEASSYYLEMMITSAIKDGGSEVRLSLENLTSDCWSHEAIQANFRALRAVIDAGYMKPGGAGTHYLAAQTGWSVGQEALLYPSGAWIANEMRKQILPDFELMVAPVPTTQEMPLLPYEAIHLTSSETFLIPADGKNVAGAKEYLRALLSREAAAAFTSTVQAPSIVREPIPEDAYGSSALASQVQLIAGAGADTFHWRFDTYYGLRRDHVVIMNSFLDGQMDVPTLTAQLQELTDRVREDPTIEKYTAD